MRDPLASVEAWVRSGAERIHLPEGLLGFESYKDFLLTRSEELEPFLALVCDDDPSVAFVVALPELFYEGEYRLPLSSEDRGLLQLSQDEQPKYLVIVCLGEDGQEVTANLKGPVAVNPRCRLAKQVVVYNPTLSLRAPLLRSFAHLPIPVRGEA